MPRGRGSLIAHHWQPIADLPSDWQALCREDLHAIHERWTAARERLADPDRVRQVQDRLMTVWAIETGIIERLYEVDRCVTIALAKPRSTDETRLEGVAIVRSCAHRSLLQAAGEPRIPATPG